MCALCVQRTPQVEAAAMCVCVPCVCVVCLCVSERMLVVYASVRAPRVCVFRLVCVRDDSGTDDFTVKTMVSCAMFCAVWYHVPCFVLYGIMCHVLCCIVSCAMFCAVWYHVPTVCATSVGFDLSCCL
jgi:hypothetical protein